MREMRKKTKVLLQPLIKKSINQSESSQGSLYIMKSSNGISQVIYNMCNICGSKNNFKNNKFCGFSKKSIFRDKMYCEKCDSQERHRFICEYFKKNKNFIKDQKVVHCAPEHCLNYIAKSAKVYHKINLNPNPYLHETKMDIKDMIFESESIDTFICSHVLEHVKDDDKAMKEISRILRKDGTAILLVPINGREHTTEFLNPNQKNFDHHRDYGYVDFMNKLKLYFTSVKRILPQDILTPEIIELCSLSYEKDQGIFECKK